MSFSRGTAIVLPAYNEEVAIADTIREFHDSCPGAQICVIDNNSRDRTAEIARATLAELGAGIVLSEPRQGKGFALRRAFQSVDADIYLMADADCTYPARFAHVLVAKIADGSADMVVGNRFFEGAYQKQNKRRFHSAGNQLVCFLINLLFKADLHDPMSGYRAFSRRFVRNWPIMSAGFEIEVEMTLHCLDKRFRLSEVPIEYRERPTGSVSKLSTFGDGLKILRLIVMLFKDFKPLAFFATVGFVSAIGGLAAGSVVIEEFYRTQYITHVPLAILAAGMMVLAVLLVGIGLILDSSAQWQKFNYEHRLTSAEPAEQPETMPNAASTRLRSGV